jgi:hypothetical protein
MKKIAKNMQNSFINILKLKVGNIKMLEYSEQFRRALLVKLYLLCDKLIN